MPSLFKMISHFSSFLRSCAKPAPIRPFMRLFEMGAHRGHAAMIFSAKRGVFTGGGVFLPARRGCQLGIVRDGWQVMWARRGR